MVNFIDFPEFNRIDRALRAISSVNMAMVHADNEEGYLTKLDITLQDPIRGRGPAATTIRTGRSVVIRDIEKDEIFKPWRKDALRLGFKSGMSIPFIVDNKTFGILGIYSSETDQFDTEEEKLIVEMANDLSYAIMFLRNRNEKKLTAEELKRSLEKMGRILMQAVTSLGNTMDIRDSYTAGHQRKVVRLATAIAEEMGLSKDQIEGISVAGNLHDIGKIYIPIEILSRPGKLSDIEFSMIKSHPQAGYEIVRNIEFPRPVADVVEAMASHRPYRPALGIDKAMEEIAQNSGILYDPVVVGVCLMLFREKGFKLE